MDSRRALTVGGTTALFALGVIHALRGSEFQLDVLISLIGLLLFLRLYDTLHQDSWSYGAFLLLLVLHSANLYWVQLPLVRFDHLLHVYGGFALGLVAERIVSRERWPHLQRAAVIVLLVMGVSAMHEIAEFFGYLFLGPGEGFLFYGLGDEGDWMNAMFDLAADFLGSLFALVRME